MGDNIDRAGFGRNISDLLNRTEHESAQQAPANYHPPSPAPHGSRPYQNAHSQAANAAHRNPAIATYFNNASGASHVASPEHAILSEAEMHPYRYLEEVHHDLFATGEITCIDTPNFRFPDVMDVEYGEAVVINTARDGVAHLGTEALATCIGICARGENAHGEKILGLHHYNADQNAADSLQNMKNLMAEQGAFDIKLYLVGGTAAPGELGSFVEENNLLSLREHFPITGAKLHLSVAREYDEENPPLVNLVMSAENIVYSKEALY